MKLELFGLEFHNSLNIPVAETRQYLSLLRRAAHLMLSDQLR